MFEHELFSSFTQVLVPPHTPKKDCIYSVYIVDFLMNWPVGDLKKKTFLTLLRALRILIVSFTDVVCLAALCCRSNFFSFPSSPFFFFFNHVSLKSNTHQL